MASTSTSGSMKSEPASASRHRTCPAVGPPDPGTWSVAKRFPRAPAAHSLRVGFFLGQIVRVPVVMEEMHMIYDYDR